MNSTNKLFKLAERFAQKISLAQSAQAGEIQNVLKEGRVWGTPETLFPFADEAGVPQNVTIYFNIVVNPDLSVLFRVQPPVPDPKVVPPATLIKMTKLMKDRLGPSMQQALKTITIKEHGDKEHPDKITSQRPVALSNSVVLKWHGLK